MTWKKAKHKEYMHAGYELTSSWILFTTHSRINLSNSCDAIKINSCICFYTHTHTLKRQDFFSSVFLNVI